MSYKKGLLSDTAVGNACSVVMSTAYPDCASCLRCGTEEDVSFRPCLLTERHLPWTRINLHAFSEPTAQAARAGHGAGAGAGDGR